MSASATNESQIQTALAHLRTTLPNTPTDYEAALLTTVSALTEELIQVQEVVRRQEQTIAQLLSRAGQSVTRQRRSAPTTPLPGPPKPIRSMEYWLAHAPDYGEPLTAEELAAFQSKPRVRPEDIQLTPADLERQPRRASSSPPAPQWIPILVLAIIGLLGMLCVLGLWFQSTIAL